MRFATKQDIEAPIRAVFDSLTNFETWERAAMRRGAEVDRIDRMAGIGPGMVWQTQFQYRSKARKLRLELTHIETPHHLAFAALSDVLEGTAQIELLELGTKRTRMQESNRVLVQACKDFSLDSAKADANTALQRLIARGSLYPELMNLVTQPLDLGALTPEQYDLIGRSLRDRDAGTQ